ncbi:Lnb N-terminal periplasmic domain-containing protein [Bordetella trematum]|uniref:Lnb N-terminal periplasmic domain-containing protein n=1 Tax=Bordetella trematum TaxID=123899 RepID=UPI000D8D3E5E|nr:DUF4105 domain-containing protein [Bordetella trematum]SPU50200.1 Uncharacterised protein [Bordetella trematum]VDH07937.1 Uncharacterised protein [Bordetella trematum]
MSSSSIRVAHPVWRALGLAGLLVFTLWGALALWYPTAGWPQRVLPWLWGLLGLAAAGALLARRCAARMLTWAWCLAAAALLIWWQSLTPSNDRAWADDVARMVYGTREGSRVTLHNVRDFRWRSDEDYTVRWDTRTYDLDQLDSVDMVLSTWGMPAIAHTLVSFGFEDGQRVVFSVEIRKERGEQFSELGGFFKQFELSVVAADERDILNVRAAARGEQVSRYPIRLSRPAMRELFLAYVAQAEALRETPRFYHTVTANCTTLVYDMALAIAPGLPLDWRLLLSGYLPEYLYEHGALDTAEPLQAWRARADITARLAQTPLDDAYSRAIRQDGAARATP